MTKEELYTKIKDLNNGEGFDIVDFNEHDDDLYYGVRFVELVDSPFYVFASYGGYTTYYNLTEYGSNIIEIITDEIFDTLEGTDRAYIREVGKF